MSNALPPQHFPICVLHLLEIIPSSDLNVTLTTPYVLEKGKGLKIHKSPSVHGLRLGTYWDPGLALGLAPSRSSQIGAWTEDRCHKTVRQTLAAERWWLPHRACPHGLHSKGRQPAWGWGGHWIPGGSCLFRFFLPLALSRHLPYGPWAPSPQ